jgi:hypothetical protein
MLDFRLNEKFDNVSISTIEKFDPKNMGVAAGILCLSALEVEIHLWGNFTPWTTNVAIFYWTIRGLNHISILYGVG